VERQTLRQWSLVVVGALALSFAACPPSRSAIQVTVQVDPAVKSTCFRVVAVSPGGAEVVSEPVARKDQLVVAVYSSEALSGAVTLTARGFWGRSGCDGALTLNDESAPVQSAFVEGSVPQATLEVKALPLSLDADADGFRAAFRDGPDCSDSLPLVNPTATEVCGDRADNDCDGLADCAAPTCEGFTCDDGSLCTVMDRCSNGTCAGTQRQCGGQPGQCALSGTCNPANGACVSVFADAGTTCDDGNPCTSNDTCLSDGGCGGATAACSTPPGPCFAAMGTCQSDGGCTYVPLDAGAVCNDGNACTTTDRCTATGTCSGTTVTCASPPGQCFGAMGMCNPNDGGCVYLVNAGMGCNDSDTCTLADTCLADGGCTGTAFTCGSPPNTCFGASGACLADGGCAYPARDAGSPCDDGNLCTSNDTCSATQSCDAVARTCTPPSACFTGGLCDQDAGCVFSVNTGGGCNDGDSCTFGESCLADGGCGTGTAYSCTTPPSSCFGASGACQGDGGCVYPVGALYSPCDGGACRADGGCAAPAFPFTPSNFDPAVVAAAGLVGSVTLNCAAVFDSSPDASTPFVNWCGQPQPNVVAVPQADGGTEAVVLGMYALTVAPDAGSLRVQGTRPVIFAVFDTATLAGPVLANATMGTPGPGGSAPQCGPATGGNGGVSNNRGGGGGGGGFGTPGANGGQGNNNGGTIGAAGTARGGVDLAPLRGGCSGGRGGGATGFGVGGAGGGAVQFSVASRLLVSGIVSVSGGGGREGASNSSGGGGGGSGGGLLLEAASMSIANTARLTANGGGGGEGDQNDVGDFGDNGALATATVAAGGSGNGGGNGGNGGAGGTAPTTGTDDNNGGGGGGGAVGRIRLNGFGACTVDPAAVLSPAASRAGCP
jgi:hypothetical protein